MQCAQAKTSEMCSTPKTPWAKPWVHECYQLHHDNGLHRTGRFVFAHSTSYGFHPSNQGTPDVSVVEGVVDGTPGVGEEDSPQHDHDDGKKSVGHTGVQGEC